MRQRWGILEIVVEMEVVEGGWKMGFGGDEDRFDF
jgi:hypothetical protein